MVRRPEKEYRIKFKIGCKFLMASQNIFKKNNNNNKSAQDNSNANNNNNKKTR
jgi:hypothetical protein